MPRICTTSGPTMMEFYRKNGVVLFVLVLAVTHYSMANMSKIEQENEQDYWERIVYDISPFAGGDGINQTINIPSHVYTEGNVSLFYYKGDEIWQNNSDHLIANDTFGIAYMVFANSSDPLNISINPVTKETPSIGSNMKSSVLHSVTITYHHLSSCNCSEDQINSVLDNIENIKKRFGLNTALSNSVKLGIEFNTLFLESCDDLYPPVNDSDDYTILSMVVSPLTTMLSFEQFSKFITDLAMDNRQFIRARYANVKLYIRLESANWANTISLANYNRYEALHVQYLKAWIKQNSGEETFIFQPFPENFILRNKQFLKAHVASPITSDYSTAYSNKYSNNNSLSCVPQELIKLQSHVFSSLLLENPSMTFFNSTLTRCILSNMTALELLKAQNSSTSVILHYGLHDKSQDNEDLEAVGEWIVDNFGAINIRTVYLGTGEGQPQDGLLRLLDKINSKNISTSCSLEARNFLETDDQFEDYLHYLFTNVTEECGSRNFTASNELLITFTSLFSSDKETLNFLSRIDKLKERFEKTFPEKILTPFINFAYKFESRMLCPSNEFFARNHYNHQQAIFSFANIHKWDRVFVGNGFSHSYGLWTDLSVITDQHVALPVFYRSVLEKQNGEDLPHTFLCVHWITEAKNSGIDFMGNSHVGATFDVKLVTGQRSRLLSQELEVTLSIALAKFPLVELITEDEQEFKQATEVVSQEFTEDVKKFRKITQSNSPLVYLEVPMADIDTQSLAIIKSVNDGVIGVHVRDWEGHPETQLSANNFNNFGVTIQDCEDEIKSGFFNFTQTQLSKRVNFVVCNVLSISLNELNQDHMNKYFENLYYTKSYMEKILPALIGGRGDIEVMFRLNVKEVEGKCFVKKKVYQNKLLAFLNMVNEHSAAYKVKYFVVSAFGTQSSADPCPYTWWRIEDNTDLTNISVYVDTQDEYWGRPTSPVIIPITFSSKGIVQSVGNDLYYIGVAIFAVVFASALAVIVIIWLRNRPSANQWLTQGEINQFYNGAGTANDEMEMLSKNFQESMFMKYPKNFEVPLKDIEKGELVGSGQFGMVLRGMIISKEMEIAIKIPRSDCGKEQFMSALSELKILAHIGSHDNVVSFMGAYTKDIGKGKLYVLTEFCENGSLLGYLREQQSKQTGEATRPHIDVHTLCAFSCQIARGMEYVSEKRIVHGDLATRNILLTGEYTCKIADFGLSRRLYGLNEYKKTSVEPLPWRWMAPESLRNFDFTTKSDVWSYGVTLWEIFSLGKVPYTSRVWNDAFLEELQIGMRMGKAEFATADIHAIMMKCWDVAPEERPGFKEVRECFSELNTADYSDIQQI